ncbi:MAG TPA: XVIPCD domain-containing protein, partial [Pseudoxanthomonas sp.]|nr:XVIPCD domain-containing protein [Pseudoxanthomonas sp.]
HPDHPLYTQAVAKLEQLGPQAFASRQQLENAAGSLVSEAKGIGMQRIDVVIQNRDGTGLFVVQGNPNDPASPRIYTDKSVATERSLAQSSNALLQDAQGQQQEQQRPRGSVIC